MLSISKKLILSSPFCCSLVCPFSSLSSAMRKMHKPPVKKKKPISGLTSIIRAEDSIRSCDRQGKKPTPEMIHSLICAYTKCHPPMVSRAGIAMESACRMLKREQIYPETFATLAAAWLTLDQGEKQVENYVKSEPLPQIRVGTLMCNELLRFYVLKRRPPDGRGIDRVLALMAARKIPADEKTYHYLVLNCGFKVPPDVELAEKLVGAMMATGSKPSALVLTSLLKVYALSHPPNVEKAKLLLNKIKEEYHLEITKEMQCELLRAWCHVDIDKGLEYFRSNLQLQGDVRFSRPYELIIHGLLEDGRLEEAKREMENMPFAVNNLTQAVNRHIRLQERYNN